MIRVLSMVMLTVAALAAPLAAEAQQAGNVPRIGYLEIASAELPIAQAMIEAIPARGCASAATSRARHSSSNTERRRGGFSGSRISWPS